MKRVFAILLACMMILGVSVSVFAAESPTGEDELDYVELNAYNLTVYVDGEEIEAGYIYSDDDNYDAAVDLYSDPESYVDDSDYEIAYVVDVTPEDTGAATVEFYADDIEEADDAIVLHCIDGDWVEEDAEIIDGVLTVEVDSFSPFAIYLYNEEVETTTEETTTATEETESTSDKTGESGTMMLLITAIAFAAAIGAAVSVKKIKG